jgi:hypothetical protein
MPTVYKPTNEGARKDRKYPYYGFPQCLRLATIVKEHGGELGGVPKSVLARDMHLDQNAASFAQIVASAKTWGFVSGSAELILTDVGRAYFYPTTESAKKLAELSLLTIPTAYAYLVKEYDGSRIPSTEIIANKLGKCGVPESWRMRAAQIFVSTATEFGVLDQGGVLRFAASMHITGQQIAEDPVELQQSNNQNGSNQQTSEPTQAIDQQSTSSTTGRAWPVHSLIEPGTNVWSFSEQAGTVRVETPPTLTPSLWKRLKKYVDLIEPTDETTEGTQGGTERAP